MPHIDTTLRPPVTEPLRRERQSSGAIE